MGPQCAGLPGHRFIRSPLVESGRETSVPTKKTNPKTSPPELIPGHGGRLTFVEDGVILFIPKSFLADWPVIAVKVSKNGERLTMERRELDDE